ncbi:hypothetical protein [Zoogloea sp.]|uniref:hypothetical protein n=1 Tax=Zoogloea sp. TaxID=49181 RepID=UPI0035B0E85B
MTIEIHGDERDWEPGGIYYDGPVYTPEEDDEDYDDCEVEDRDTYEAEHDYSEDDADDYDTPAPCRPTYQAPARQKLTTLKMPRPVRVQRYIDDEF